MDQSDKRQSDDNVSKEFDFLTLTLIFYFLFLLLPYSCAFSFALALVRIDRTTAGVVVDDVNESSIKTR